MEELRWLGPSKSFAAYVTRFADTRLLKRSLQGWHQLTAHHGNSGFEAAVDHYMMTGEPFFGRGMPHIGDDLYLPYVDEARAAFGVALDGTHHPDMDFQVTVPTSLVIARQGRKIDTEGGTLPKWVKSGDLWVEAPA